MTARDRSVLALIIDHDLGFLMWLGEVFDELGCQSVPALHCRRALALVKQFDLPIGTLVINPELLGAERLVKRVVAENPRVRVVLIRNSTGLDPAEPKASACCRWACSILERPMSQEPISRVEWLRKIRQILPSRDSY